MMKKVIFLILVLCSFSVFAENNISPYSVPEESKAEYEKIKKEVTSCHQKAGSNNIRTALKNIYDFDVSVFAENHFLNMSEKFYGGGEELNIKDLEYLKNYFSKYENDNCFKYLVLMMDVKPNLEEVISDIKSSFAIQIYKNYDDYVRDLNNFHGSFFNAYYEYTNRIYYKKKKLKAMDSL